MLVAWIAVAGCDDGAGGSRELGDRCERGEDCSSGLCVGGVDGDEPRCTRSCATELECPRGWSCSGVTENDILVCRKGAATPFGH